jgi:DNA-binding MarR family transcriptional regulator
MTKKVNRPHLSKNQQKILDILAKYEELTAKDVAEILWARNIRYKTPEYSSTARSLRTLYKRGLVEKAGGQVKWRKTKK